MEEALELSKPGGREINDASCARAGQCEESPGERVTRRSVSGDRGTAIRGNLSFSNLAT